MPDSICKNVNKQLKNNKPLEAIGRLLFGSVDMVAIGEMLILSQTFGDKRPMEQFGEGRGGWDDGNGGGREQGSDGGPEGTGEVRWFVGVIITELGRHFTVTIPVGSERNHSDRWRIRSVCLWWTWNFEKNWMFLKIYIFYVKISIPNYIDISK